VRGLHIPYFATLPAVLQAIPWPRPARDVYAGRQAARAGAGCMPRQAREPVPAVASLPFLWFGAWAKRLPGAVIVRRPGGHATRKERRATPEVGSGPQVVGPWVD
jgi:hypothetical protein